MIKSKNKFTDLPIFFQVFAVVCGLMLSVAVYGFLIDSFIEARVFLYTGLTGFLLFALIKLATSNRNLREPGIMQLISLFLLFIFLPLFLAVPAWIILSGISFFDAYVDMVGVFTTTGLPVFENDAFSKTIRLWRALIAWFGGGLILIAAFLILLPASLGGFDVFSKKEINSNLKRKLTHNERSMNLTKISKKLIPIYLGLTLILWGFLTSLGTDGYTSLIRAFSILSTSGIPGHEKFGSDGAGFLGELLMAMFLLLALSSNIFYSVNSEKKLKKNIFNKEVRLGLLTVIIITLVLTTKNLNANSMVFNFKEAFVSGCELIWGNFFTALSFITTNGYVSSYWEGNLPAKDIPHLAIILIGLCLFGGGLATTAGGIKLLRISVLFTAFSNETGKLLHPSSVAGSNINLKSLEISVFMAWVFFMLFIVSLALLTIILSIFGMSFEQALVFAVACLTTAGPIIQVVGVEPSLVADLPYFSKLALVIGMILGRLEILFALSVMTFALKRA